MKTPQFVMINNFVIDVSVREDHSFESEVTDYPVESGGSFSDNIRRQPISVTMEGIVSNTPIGDVEAIRGINTEDLPEVSAAKAYAVLRGVWESGEPVTIRTSLGTFENMALQSLSVPRDGDTGDALRFTAVFQQIVTVTNKRVRMARKDLGPRASERKVARTAVWNVGFTPGKRPIKETRLVYLLPKDETGKVHIWYHADKKTALTPREFFAFMADYRRDMFEEKVVAMYKRFGADEAEARKTFRRGADFIRQPGELDMNKIIRPQKNKTKVQTYQDDMRQWVPHLFKS